MTMSFAAFVLGGAAWTASEYLIHRFVGHGGKRKQPPTLLGRITPAGLAYEFNREHLAHHATPSYFAPTYRKVLAASVAIPVLGAAAAPFVGVRRATSFALGFATVYGGYEVVHRFIRRARTTASPPPSGTTSSARTIPSSACASPATSRRRGWSTRAAPSSPSTRTITRSSAELLPPPRWRRPCASTRDLLHQGPNALIRPLVREDRAAGSQRRRTSAQPNRGVGE